MKITAILTLQNRNENTRPLVRTVF